MSKLFTINEIRHTIPSYEGSFIELPDINSVEEKLKARLNCPHPIWGMGLLTVLVFEQVVEDSFKLIRKETPVPEGGAGTRIKWVNTEYK